MSSLHLPLVPDEMGTGPGKPEDLHTHREEPQSENAFACARLNLWAAISNDYANSRNIAISPFRSISCGITTGKAQAFCQDADFFP
jgi:hypothetical protein